MKVLDPRALVRRIACATSAGGLSQEDGEALLTREWLVTNGLGGYASGTISGVTTRRYHGLLIAALPAPFGRLVMLSHLSEQFRLADGRVVRFGGEEWAGGRLDLHGAVHLSEFRLEGGLPVWRYVLGDCAFEKQVYLQHGQNTVYVTYRLTAGSGPLRLKLRPSVHFRPHEAPVSLPLAEPYTLTIVNSRCELAAPGNLPPLRLYLTGERPAFTVEGRKLQNMLYRVEGARGYESAGDLWTPGYFRVDLTPEQPATFVASTEPWDALLTLTPAEVHTVETERRSRLLAVAGPVVDDALGAELVLAADQFIITPVGRVEHAIRARAAGDEVRTVIAGYHWFTDWGRDTMIGLEGLTLTTGRHEEAGYILRTFAHYVRDGLIPNLFPEGEREGLYHTADATLWFFHAIDRYVATTGNQETLRRLLPVLADIVAWHLRGTRFGIGVDPEDGLLRQGAEGYQLTWMDAKVGDWVVTPRRGKAVEINALWYNALRLMEAWTRDAGGEDAARPYGAQADRVARSFNRRFWNEREGCLFDVVDGEGGDDPACRPNQLFAVSLPHPVLDPSRWRAVVETAERRLLTPVGLRSLAPGHPDYKSTYRGDLRARDAAYHQGTVWAWLIGPFVDAWARVYPDDRAGARRFLEGFARHLNEACVGSISEVFDAEPPFSPGGCIAQGWSVAEVLRVWAKTGGDGENGAGPERDRP
jgi:predicted glycogen debranching enzyme